LHSRENYGIDLMGPVHVDPSWQARTPEALDVEHFQIDWQQQRAICPQGQQSNAWHLSQDAKGESIVQILFPKHICQACPVHEKCTNAQQTGRSMTLRFPQERHELLQAARVRQQTEEFKSVYHRRAGIEGTFSQTTRNTGLRRSRYIGLGKNAPPAHSFSGSNEYSSLRAMAHESSLGENSDLTFCGFGSMTMSSPTVSNSPSLQRDSLTKQERVLTLVQ
jgi:DDE family transposase